MTLKPKTISAAHGGAALRWLDTQHSERQWALSAEEQRLLLGGVAVAQFNTWMASALRGDDIDLPEGVIERLGLLLSIYRSFKTIALAGHEAAWFRRSYQHPLFGGRSTKQVLLDDPSMTNLRVVAHYWWTCR